MIDKDAHASESRELLMSAEELTARCGGLANAISQGEALRRLERYQRSSGDHTADRADHCLDNELMLWL